LKHSITLALAATLTLALPTMAQDATQSPATGAESPAAATQDSGIAFPVMLGGQVLTPETFSGADWLAQFEGGDQADAAYVSGMQALLEGAGATVDDLTVKSAMYRPAEALPSASPADTYQPAEGEAVVVMAMRIAGTDARTWIRDAVDVVVSDVTEPGLVMRPLDTKWTLRVTDANLPGVYPRTVYLKDDTAWFIQGDTDYVWDALGQLPDADPIGLSSADRLYTDVPLALDGARRIGLYESTEPLFLPTIGARLGNDIEDWLLELYLDTRISPAQMIGVIAWWGLEASSDGIQIEGYRLPAGGEEMTQRLLQDVFLIRPPEDPEAVDADPVALQLQGTSFSEEEIGGKSVTVLDNGDTKQYIFTSNDTIWVVSDPLGERDRVEEAITSVP